MAARVIVDAFIVRMTLVPAILHLLGHSAWWLPRSLQKILANVDIEGANLAATPIIVEPGSRGGSEGKRPVMWCQG